MFISAPNYTQVHRFTLSHQSLQLPSGTTLARHCVTKQPISMVRRGHSLAHSSSPEMWNFNRQCQSVQSVQLANERPGPNYFLLISIDRVHGRVDKEQKMWSLSTATWAIVKPPTSHIVMMDAYTRSMNTASLEPPKTTAWVMIILNCKTTNRNHERTHGPCQQLQQPPNLKC